MNIPKKMKYPEHGSPSCDCNACNYVRTRNAIIDDYNKAFDSLALEAIIYDHFPMEDNDFVEGVKSEYTMDELRKSCEDTIRKLFKGEI